MVWVRGARRHLCEGEGQHESVSLHQTEGKCSQNVLKWNSSDFQRPRHFASQCFWGQFEEKSLLEISEKVNQKWSHGSCEQGFNEKRISKVFTRIGEKYNDYAKREKEHFKYISSITSKFKLCFVIDVVTISYSLYWHRIVFWEKKSITLIAFICDGDIDIYVVEIKNANIVLL